MSNEDFQNLDENLKDEKEVELEDEGLAKGQINLEEEAIESPTKMMFKKFFANKLGVVGLVGFIIVFVVVFGGSFLLPYDAYFSQPVLKDTSPGYGYMNYPKDLIEEGVKDIQVGSTFSAGLSEAGNVYTWGHDIADNDKEPEELESLQGTFEHILVGDNHIMAATKDGEFIGWGNNQFGQRDLPPNLEKLVKEEGVKKLGGSDMFSVLLTEKGTIKVWGSTLPTGLNLIPPTLDGMVEDFEASTTNILLLLKDGTLDVIGQRGTEIETSMPEELKNGSVKIKEIGRMMYSGAALDESGKLHTWGALADNNNPPEDMEGNVVKLASGRAHMAALTDAGRIYTWGKDNYGTLDTPDSDGHTDIFTGYFNNYALKDGDIDTWGLDGFILGSDNQGRDVLTRIIHGGRVSLVVAFVSVVVMVIIGTIVGIVAGFYGGWVDNLLMRASEIVSSFPFYPLIITLSAILPVDMSQNQRLMMIMLILGFINWPSLARLIRAEILSEREKDYITAAKALGIKEGKIMLTHMVPNIISIIIVQATIGYATNLLVEAALSFVGFGVRPPFPSWGNILSDASTITVLESYWWRWIPTGLAVFLAALTVNLMGDALNEAVDPRSQER